MHQPRERDFLRARAMPFRNSRERWILGCAAGTLRTAERPMRDQADLVRRAVFGDAAQHVLVVPDAELDLHGRDLANPPRLFDVSDGHVAESDVLDEALALERRERADARGQGRSRIDRVQLIESNPADA